MKPTAPLVVLTSLFISLPLSSSSLPGLQIRITKKGLDYGNSVAHAALSRELKELRISDQSGSDGKIQWELSGVENRGVTIPSSAMAFNPAHNGLSWAINGLGIDLHARHWRVKYKKGWFKVSTSGSVDIRAKRASLLVTVSLGQKGGQPSVAMSHCDARIGDVSVKFHGGTSFILNMFRGVIGKKIKNLVQGKICTVVRKVIEEDGNDELAQLKVNVGLDKNFLLDYSLVSAPKVKATGLELQNKGEIYWKADMKEAPFSPEPIPELDDESRMMYLWVTDYVVNTAIHQAFTHNFLQYNVTEKDFPSSEKETFLDTTCSSLCIGTLVPELSKVFPNSKVEARTQALAPPSISISPNGINLNGDAGIDLRIVTKDGQIYDFINIEMEISLSVTGTVRYERLAGMITEHRLKVNQIQSPFGDINPKGLNEMLKVALDLGIMPALNALMMQGIDLPVTKVMSFKNIQLRLFEGSILIATDIADPASRPTQQEIRQELQEERQRQQQEILLEQLQVHRQKQEKREEQQRQQQQKEQEQEQLKKVELPSTETPKPTEQPQHSKEPETSTWTETPKYTEQSQTSQLNLQQQEYTPEQSIMEQMPESTRQQEKTEPNTNDEAKPFQSQENKDVFCDRLADFCHSSMNYCN